MRTPNDENVYGTKHLKVIKINNAGTFVLNEDEWKDDWMHLRLRVCVPWKAEEKENEKEIFLFARVCVYFVCIILLLLLLLLWVWVIWFKMNYGCV